MSRFPREIDDIVNKLINGGFQAYAAGVCVRERERGIQPIDWDIVTDASLDEIQELFSNGHRLEGMVRVQSEVLTDDEGYIVDITSLNGNTIEEDLAKRIYTCNAIALDKDRVPVDPFNGRNDIRNKVVSLTGDAIELFREKPARIFEAVKVAAEIGGELAPEVKEAVLRCSPLLTKVPRELLRDELIGILNAEDAGKGLHLLLELDLLGHIVGEKNAKLGKRETRDYEHMCGEINDIDYVTERRLAIFYMNFNGRKVLPYIEAYKYDKYTLQCLNDMVFQLPVVNFMQTRQDLKKCIAEIGMERYEYLNRLDRDKWYVWGGRDKRIVARAQLLKSIINNGEILSEKDLPVSRQELTAAGYAPAEYMDRFIAALIGEIAGQKNPKPDHDEVMALAEKVSKKTKLWKK